MKELTIYQESTQDQQSQTYKHLKTSDANIVKRRVHYMSRHKVEVTDDQNRFSFFHWIPKMHKDPSKQRIHVQQNFYPKLLLFETHTADTYESM